MKTLQREYYFSDTYGSPGGLPIDQIDPDAIISTDLRSQTQRYRHEKFDIYHQPHVTDHIMRMVHDLDAEIMDTLRGKRKDNYVHSTTGIFINSAPRTSETGNGSLFHVATSREGRIRTVTTPLSALSPVRDEIETLSVLPSEDNGLYKNGEQFRSSYTPVLLQEDHGYHLHDLDPEEIPPFREDLHIAYVDRFGNVITYAGSETIQSVLQTINTSRDDIVITLNGREYGPYGTAKNLGSAKSGVISVYENEDLNVDVARKWQEGETSTERLELSAYEELGQPRIGDAIAINRNELVRIDVE